MSDLKEKVISEIKKIYDPEIPVNIYELGLIYNIDIDEKNKVNIDMTLTSPNCPVAESLPNSVKDSVLKVDGVTELLTERQLDILKLISNGLSNKLIARKLFLSENTVKVHVSAILRALSLSNRTQAGLVGQKLELIKATQLSENGGL